MTSKGGRPVRPIEILDGLLARIPLAGLPVAERSHRLRALVEEERGLSRRGESFGSGSGR
jgi:hypothetical protein